MSVLGGLPLLVSIRGTISRRPVFYLLAKILQSDVKVAGWATTDRTVSAERSQSAMERKGASNSVLARIKKVRSAHGCIRPSEKLDDRAWNIRLTRADGSKGLRLLRGVPGELLAATMHLRPQVWFYHSNSSRLSSPSFLHLDYISLPSFLVFFVVVFCCYLLLFSFSG